MLLCEKKYTSANSLKLVFFQILQILEHHHQLKTNRETYTSIIGDAVCVMESPADSRILTLTWEIIGIILLVILIQFIILMMTSVTEMIGLPTSIGDFSFFFFFNRTSCWWWESFFFLFRWWMKMDEGYSTIHRRLSSCRVPSADYIKEAYLNVWKEKRNIVSSCSIGDTRYHLTKPPPPSAPANTRYNITQHIYTII